MAHKPVFSVCTLAGSFGVLCDKVNVFPDGLYSMHWPVFGNQLVMHILAESNKA